MGIVPWHLSPLKVTRLTGRLMDTSNLLTETEKQVNKKYLFMILLSFYFLSYLGESSDTEQGGFGEMHQGAGDQEGCVPSKNRRPC